MKKNTIKKNTLYWVGRPEVSACGRFNQKFTTYQTAIVDDNGKVTYRQQTYKSLGTKEAPKDVIKVTKAEFLKMLKSLG